MDQTFWQKEPNEVAKQLVGKTIIVGTVSATVLVAEGYTRKQNESGLYKPILDMPPGQLYCPQHRNAILVLISTRYRGKPGGCVLLRAVEVNGSICEGPGRVAECLGIIHSKTMGKAEVIDEGTFWFRLDTSEHPGAKKPKVKARELHRNGLTASELERVMPKIARRYLKQKPGMKFQDYLNDLLAQASTLAELQKLLS